MSNLCLKKSKDYKTDYEGHIRFWLNPIPKMAKNVAMILFLRISIFDWVYNVGCTDSKHHYRFTNNNETVPLNFDKFYSPSQLFKVDKN